MDFIARISLTRNDNHNLNKRNKKHFFARLQNKERNESNTRQRVKCTVAIGIFSSLLRNKKRHSVIEPGEKKRNESNSTQYTTSEEGEFKIGIVCCYLNFMM